MSPGELSWVQLYALGFATVPSCALLALSRASLFAAIAIGLLTGALHQVVWLGVPGELWAHVIFGLMLCFAAQYSLNGDGGPLAIVYWHGGAVTLASLALIAGEIRATRINSLHSFVHLVLELMMMSYGAFATISGALRARGWTVTAARVSTLRTLHDPMVLCAIGFILTRHLHDTAPLAVHFHEVQGAGLIALGAANFACSLAHARLPRDDAAATLLRLLCATLWLLNGLWLYHMAFFLYLLPGRRGLHHLLWPSADVDESIVVYLAIDSWLAVLIVCAWYWRLVHGRPPLPTQGLASEAESVPLTAA
mmetsp:Transcript_63563/g.105704  ORF Transcript_63563/g.105704 Transcript_63563/m.105704 type:complete len:309 (+) Transcript_63563:224-1150(+)